MIVLQLKSTVKKIDHSLKHVKTNLRFCGLSQSFDSRFQNNLTEAELKKTRLKRIESKIAREAASKAQNTSNTQYTSYTQNKYF